MEKILNKLELLIKKGDTVLVFPSEITSSAWQRHLLEYTRLKALRVDHIISWDTFKVKVFGRNRTEVPVNGMIRRVFAAKLLEDNERDPFLSHIIPAQYAKDSKAFTSSITATLPGLFPFLQQYEQLSPQEQQLPELLMRDLQQLSIRYREFLQQQALFEPSEFPLRLSGLSASEQDKKYLILFPEVITDFQEISGEIADLSWISTVSISFLQADPPAALQVFENAAQELEQAMDRLEHLLSLGVSPESIAVTLADFDRWAPEFEEAAALRAIPVTFRRGKSLSSFPLSRFFRDIAGTAQQNYSLEAMKKLLLNCGYPWRDRRAFQRLIQQGIKFSCIRNTGKPGSQGDLWLQRLRAAGESELLELYKRLTFSIQSLITETQPAELHRKLILFMAGFLDFEQRDALDKNSTGQELAPAEEAPGALTPPEALEPGGKLWEQEKRVVQFCLDRLQALVQACNLGGFTEITSLYATWLQILDAEWYVPQQAKGGISVYPYGVSAGIYPEHHILLGVTQKASAMTHQEIPFLPDYLSQAFTLQVKDFTDPYAALYASSGKQVYPSCSRKDLDGAQLPASWFVDRGSAIPAVLEKSRNLYKKEQLFWAHGGLPSEYPEAIYPVQAEAVAQAEHSLLHNRYLDMLKQPLSSSNIKALVDKALPKKTVHDSGALLAISASSFDTFIQCPFIWLLRYVLRIEEVDYTLVTLDNRQVGILIHECFTRLFTQIQKETESFKKAELERYTVMLQELLEEILHNFARKPAAPPAPVMHWVNNYIKTVIPLVLAAEAAQFDGWETLACEEQLLFHNQAEGYILEGRLDRYLQNTTERERAVIDYKKTKGSSLKSFQNPENMPDSFQLPLYTYLLEQSAPLQPKVSCAGYYEVTQGKYAMILTPEEIKKGITRERMDAIISDMLILLKSMADKLAAGDYRMDTRAKSCSSCDFRDVCRERYTVR